MIAEEKKQRPFCSKTFLLPGLQLPLYNVICCQKVVTDWTSVNEGGACF